MSISTPEPIDKGELQRAASQIVHELHMIDEERVKNRQPRPWHAYTDRLHAWRTARRRASHAKYGGPLIYRWWVPPALVFCLVSIWIPDGYKINFLYAADAWHDKFKFRVHCWYWKRTMEPAAYARLMEQLEANVPRQNREKSTDCPL
jgi:hypothetical protein